MCMLAQLFFFVPPVTLQSAENSKACHHLLTAHRTERALLRARIDYLFCTSSAEISMATWDKTCLGGELRSRPCVPKTPTRAFQTKSLQLRRTQGYIANVFGLSSQQMQSAFSSLFGFRACCSSSSLFLIACRKRRVFP